MHLTHLCLCAGGGAQEPPRLARGSLPTQLRGRLPTRGSLLNLFSRNTSDGDSITSVNPFPNAEDTCNACHPEALLCCIYSLKSQALLTAPEDQHADMYHTIAQNARPPLESLHGC